MDSFAQIMLRIYQTLLDAVIPRFCVGCKKEREVLCVSCQNHVFQKGFACLLCGARNSTGAFCAGSCRKKTPIALKKVFWVGRYEDILHDAIWQLKYKKRKELAELLGHLLAKKFHLGVGPLSENYCVIPIPLHPKKERERGFNQALLLAEQFSKETGIPIAKNVLQKIKDTPSQARALHRENRLANLENAFAVNTTALRRCGITTPECVGKTIILIDDVSTTGSTLFHVAKTLSAAGAQKIIALVVAHGS